MKICNLMARVAAMLLPAVFCSFGVDAWAQTRIAVVSDIHVMSPDLLEPGAESGEAWTTYYAGQRKMLEQSADLFDQFIDKMLSSKPNVVLFTGDLTKDGEVYSHEYVWNGLKKLKNAGIKALVIPGNHDIGEDGNNTIFYADGSTAEITAFSNNADFAECYADYGYSGNDSDVDPNGSLSYVAEPIEGLVVLAIDSHTRSIPDATLTWLCTKAKEARDAGKLVIAMMHHPLFPHITGADMFIDTYTVNDYEIVRDKLIDAGVRVILTGHFHTSDIAKDWTGSASANPIYDINTGSLISYPCDYRMLTLSADKRTLGVKTESLEETASLIPSGSTSWKNWLHDRVKAISTQKMKEKAGMAAAMFTTQINNIAEFAANLFILHAEGDENASADRSGLDETYQGFKNNTRYNMLLSAGGITDASIYSILDDKSYYGEDHENKTDDRTLSIRMTTQKGDVNGDGEVTITDAALVMFYNPDRVPAGFDTSAADVDGNGSITVSDAVAILAIILNQ